MKRYTIIMIFALLLCCSCGRRGSSVESAAMELYQHYAHNQHGVTVAYIGDFHAYNQVFNAVMFRADDSVQWEWIKQEFGVIEPNELVPEVEAQENVTMVSLHVDTSLHFDTPEKYQSYIDSLVRQVINETLGDYDVTDTTVFVGTVNASDTALSSQLQSQLSRHIALDENRKRGGSAEYIVSVDLENRTLLCFFCNSTEEANLLVRWLHHNES